MNLNTLTIDDIAQYVITEYKPQFKTNFKKAEKILKTMKKKTNIIHTQKIKVDDHECLGYYNQYNDHIVILHPEKFESKEMYFKTLFHELGHYTGHYNRLNRPEILYYAEETKHKEELTACLISMLLCMKTGIFHKIPVDNKTRMCDHIKKITDTGQIDESFEKAKQAVNYILGEIK